MRAPSDRSTLFVALAALAVSAAPHPVAAADPGERPWDCKKASVAFSGYEQAMAYVPKQVRLDGLDPKEVAKREAIRQLTARVAQSYGCPEIAAQVKHWKSGETPDGQTVCALAVVPRAAVDACRASSSGASLDEQLGRAARVLLEGADGAPRVAIDKIVDGNVPGGARAEWLGRRMAAALTAAGATLVELRAHVDAGGRPPRGVVLLEGRITARAAGTQRLLEVHWTARHRQRRATAVRAAPAVVFPEGTVPPGPSTLPGLPPSDAGLTLRVDTRAGGSLCVGDRYQIHLETDADLHVRVFNLYGSDGALLILPNPDHPDGHVRGGVRVPLAGDTGFEVLESPDTPYERFLVLAAPTERALGPFARLRGYCRLPRDQAAALYRPDHHPPGTRVAHDGFRIISGPACPPPPPRPADEQVVPPEDWPLCQPTGRR